MLIHHNLITEARMIRLQLIIVCGALFAAGLTWQLASDAKAQASNHARGSTELPSKSVLSNIQTD